MKTYRNPKYLSWIRTQLCAVCRKGGSQAHHEPLGENSMGGKPPDTHAIPLCLTCHYERHHFGVGWINDRIDTKMTIIKLLTRWLQKNFGEKK